MPPKRRLNREWGWLTDLGFRGPSEECDIEYMMWGVCGYTRVALGGGDTGSYNTERRANAPTSPKIISKLTGRLTVSPPPAAPQTPPERECHICHRRTAVVASQRHPQTSHTIHSTSGPGNESPLDARRAVGGMGVMVLGMVRGPRERRGEPRNWNCQFSQKWRFVDTDSPDA